MTGCDATAAAPNGFCRACRLAYERRAQRREADLKLLAAQIERDHRTVVDQLAPHGPPRALLLAHAAAHQDHSGDRSMGITRAAIRDFLDDAMERLTAERLR